MFAPVVLFVFAALAAALGPRLLLGAAWVQRAPGWGILAWQSLTVSVIAGIALVGLTLAAPLTPLAEFIAWLCRTTPAEVIEHYQTPAGAWVAYLAALAAAGLAIRMLWLTASTVVNAARGRHTQLNLLRVLGTEHPDGFVIVKHSKPLVYCLPGLRKRIVVTSAALDVLDPDQLELVLAHERSHLRSRHDLALALADVLRRALGPVAVFRVAHEQVSTLIEMQADDAAHDRHGLARALVTLGSGPAAGVPEPGLGAGNVAAVARVERLAAAAGPWKPWKRRQSLAVVLGTAILLATPVALATSPIVEMIITGCTTILG